MGVTGASERRVSRFTEAERASINAILSNPKVGPGVRAGILLRKHPTLEYSRNAKLLYLLISGFIGADGLRTGGISVSMKKLAAWINASTRSAQAAVRELVRSGPLPLLTETPGRPGRVGEYRFVSNPFAVAELQQAEAERTRQHRQPRTSRERNAIMLSRYVTEELDAGTTNAKLKAVDARLNWNLPTRPQIVTDPPRRAS